MSHLSLLYWILIQINTIQQIIPIEQGTENTLGVWTEGGFRKMDQAKLADYFK